MTMHVDWEGRMPSWMLALLTVFATLAWLLPGQAFAAGKFVVDDRAELLSAQEAVALQHDYAGLGEYVDVAFVSVLNNPSSTESFARSYVNETFTSAPAVAFVIDMDNREIYVFSNEAGLAIISRADARAITDNIYKLASARDYYGCAKAAFDQILTKCEGGRIARPVKHITNALIAIVLGIVACFYIAMHSRAGITRSMRRKAARTRSEGIPDFGPVSPVVTRTVTYRRSSSSGGSRGGGGGGRGGGGGGGGGHKF